VPALRRLRQPLGALDAALGVGDALPAGKPSAGIVRATLSRCRDAATAGFVAYSACFGTISGAGTGGLRKHRRTRSFVSLAAQGRSLRRQPPCWNCPSPPWAEPPQRSPLANRSGAGDVCRHLLLGREEERESRPRPRPSMVHPARSEHAPGLGHVRPGRLLESSAR
jgi:hypothetical protein